MSKNFDKPVEQISFAEILPTSGQNAQLKYLDASLYADVNQPRGVIHAEEGARRTVVTSPTAC